MEFTWIDVFWTYSCFTVDHTAVTPTLVLLETNAPQHSRHTKRNPPGSPMCILTCLGPPGPALCAPSSHRAIGRWTHNQQYARACWTTFVRVTAESRPEFRCAVSRSIGLTERQIPRLPQGPVLCCHRTRCSIEAWQASFPNTGGLRVAQKGQDYAAGVDNDPGLCLNFVASSGIGGMQAKSTRSAGCNFGYNAIPYPGTESF